MAKMGIGINDIEIVSTNITETVAEYDASHRYHNGDKYRHGDFIYTVFNEPKNFLTVDRKKDRVYWYHNRNILYTGDPKFIIGDYFIAHENVFFLRSGVGGMPAVYADPKYNELNQIFEHTCPQGMLGCYGYWRHISTHISAETENTYTIYVTNYKKDANGNATDIRSGNVTVYKDKYFAPLNSLIIHDGKIYRKASAKTYATATADEFHNYGASQALYKIDKLRPIDGDITTSTKRTGKIEYTIKVTKPITGLSISGLIGNTITYSVSGQVAEETIPIKNQIGTTGAFPKDKDTQIIDFGKTIPANTNIEIKILGGIVEVGDIMPIAMENIGHALLKVEASTKDHTKIETGDWGHVRFGTAVVMKEIPAQLYIEEGRAEDVFRIIAACTGRRAVLIVDENKSLFSHMLSVVGKVNSSRMRALDYKDDGIPDGYAVADIVFEEVL